jgi:Domain of unknown function (DUF4440)
MRSMHGTPSRIARLLAGVTLTLVIAGAAVAVSSASTAHSSTADQLRQIERTRLRALVNADTKTAGRLIAPDFQLINPGGATSGRDDYLASIASGDIDYLAFKPTSPIVVRQSGDAAALRFQVHFDIVIGGGALHLTHEGWITELYERHHDRWQIVWEQATAVPNDFDALIQALSPPEPTN